MSGNKGSGNVGIALLCIIVIILLIGSFLYWISSMDAEGWATLIFTFVLISIGYLVYKSRKE